MTHEWDTSGPPPELLAAYADGALTGADFEAVAIWLADHPEASQEVVEIQRLHDLMERTQPHDPRPTTWAGVLDRVHSALQVPTQPTRRPTWRVPAYAAVAAAAVFVGVVVGRGLIPANPSVAQAVRIADLERRLATLEERAIAAERSAADASRRADEATCWAHQANDRASDAERRADAEATALDMASTPRLELLTHDQVKLLTPSPKFRLDDWASPMVVDPVLNVRGP